MPDPYTAPMTTIPTDIASAQTLSQLFSRRVALTPDAPAYRLFDPTTQAWSDLSWAQTAERVAPWTQALAALQLPPGARVAILLPNGLHAVVPARPELGLLPGVIFTLRNRNHGLRVNQQNRLHPYYLVYIGNDGQIISDHSEAKRLLDLARSACKGYSQPIAQAYQPFNQATDDGRQMQAYSDLLDQAIRALIDVKQERDLDSLFSGGRTTALLDRIDGLDDFELISFLVIQAQHA